MQSLNSKYMIKATLLDIATRIVKWDKSLGIQINGVDNNYPERMERLRENSVTASMASDKMFKFVIGKGLGEESDKILINGMPIIDIADDIAHDIVDDRGVFIHVSYNGNKDIHSFRVLNFKDCRIGEIDDRKYNGKILVYDDWCSGNVKKDKIQVYDVYNPNPDVLDAQIKKAGGITSYKGQVLFYNMDRGKVYPLSRIHAVDTSCDAEHLAGVYKQRTLKYGFFGKTILITRKLIGKNKHLDLSPDGVREYQRAVDERSSFKKAWSKFIGADNFGEALHMEVDVTGTNDLDKEIVVKNIESKIDDKLFSYTETSSMSYILMAYNNLPKMLVNSTDSVFGQNGAGILEAKLSYQESTDKERSIVEKLLNTLYLKTPQGKNKTPLKLLPLIDVKTNTQPQNT